MGGATLVSVDRRERPTHVADHYSPQAGCELGKAKQTIPVVGKRSGRAMALFYTVEYFAGQRRVVDSSSYFDLKDTQYTLDGAQILGRLARC